MQQRPVWRKCEDIGCGILFLSSSASIAPTELTTPCNSSLCLWCSTILTLYSIFFNILAHVWWPWDFPWSMYRHSSLGAKLKYIEYRVSLLTQKLGQPQPFIAVFPQECMSQLVSFGPT
jgi:hypothetical protein